LSSEIFHGGQPLGYKNSGENFDLSCFGRCGGLEVEGWGPGALWRLRALAMGMGEDWRGLMVLWDFKTGSPRNGEAAIDL